MPASNNLVQQTSTTTGTGGLTLSAVTGKQSFVAGFATGGSSSTTTDAFWYFAASQDNNEWEVGSGALTAGKLKRQTIIDSNTGSRITFSAGTLDVTSDIPWESQLYQGVKGISVGTDGVHPAANKVGKLGKTTLQWDAIYLASEGTGIEFGAAGDGTVKRLNGTDKTLTTALTLAPETNEGADLGTSDLKWNDVFLATGGVINIGGTLITHAAGHGLDFTGATGGVSFDGPITPNANEGSDLGTPTLKWNDIHLATAGVINMGGTLITHAAGHGLDFTGATGGVSFDGPITPNANEGSDLGTATLKWNDVHMATGGVINIGGLAITHTADHLAITGATGGFTVDGGLFSQNAGTVAGFLSLEEPSGDSTMRFTTPALTKSLVYTFPATEGAANQVLRTDGAGVLTWVGQGSGATAALDNLAGVAINTSLISDTKNTDDLGSAAIPWLNVYLASEGGTGVHFGPDTILSRATDGVIACTGFAPAAYDGAALGTKNAANPRRFSDLFLATEGSRGAAVEWGTLKIVCATSGGGEITGGFKHVMEAEVTPTDGGAATEGFYTLTYAGGNMKRVKNGTSGGITLLPQTTTFAGDGAGGDGVIILNLENGNDADSGLPGITTATGDYDKVTGDAFTTATGDEWACTSTVINGRSWLHVTDISEP